MRFLVISGNALPASVRGYLQRFLLEAAPNLFIGSAARSLTEELRELMVQNTVTGFLAASDARAETGFRFLYYTYPNQGLTDFDGVYLPECFHAAAARSAR